MREPPRANHGPVHRKRRWSGRWLQRLLRPGGIVTETGKLHLIFCGYNGPSGLTTLGRLANPPSNNDVIESTTSFSIDVTNFA